MPIPYNMLDHFFEKARLNTLPAPAVVPFLMAGDPDLETSFLCAKALYEADVRMMEIGMPFSDPMADGPTIQTAGVRALRAGTETKDVLALCARLHSAFPDLALILMGYYNPVRAFGEQKFAQAASEAGASGVILVDLPLGADGDFPAKLAGHNLHYVRLCAPNTGLKRLAAIGLAGSGCLYQVSVTGVTGKKTALTQDLQKMVERVRSVTELPLMAGFGIKNSQDVSGALSVCDAVVVGSALIRVLADGKASEAPERAYTFWKDLCAINTK